MTKFVLIDADMRNPSPREFVDVGLEPGLTNYRSGQDFAALLQPTRWRFDFRDQYAAIPPNAVELLSSDRMRTLIAEPQKSFDYGVVNPANKG